MADVFEEDPTTRAMRQSIAATRAGEGDPYGDTNWVGSYAAGGDWTPTEGANAQATQPRTLSPRPPDMASLPGAQESVNVPGTNAYRDQATGREWLAEPIPGTSGFAIDPATGRPVRAATVNRLMEESGGAGFREAPAAAAPGFYAATPRNEQAMAAIQQRTQGMPLGQAERQHMGRLQNWVQQLREAARTGRVSEDHALHYIHQAMKEYEHLQSRDHFEQEQTKRLQQAKMLDELGMHSQAEDMIREHRAASHQRTMQVSQTTHGPVTWTTDDKGNVKVIEPPTGSVSDEPVTRNERDTNIVSERRTALQERLAARAEDRQRHERDADNKFRHELENAVHRHHLEWSAEGKDKASMPAHLKTHETRQAYILEQLNQHRPGWQQRAQLLLGQPAQQAASPPGSPPAGPPPAAPPPPQGPAGAPAAQGPPQQADAGHPATPATPESRAASAFDLNLADVRQQAAALRNPAATSYVNELSNRIAAIMRAYPPGTTPPPGVRERYRAYRSIINEHLKGEKQTPMTRQELIESFTDTARNGG